MATMFELRLVCVVIYTRYMLPRLAHYAAGKRQLSYRTILSVHSIFAVMAWWGRRSHAVIPGQHSIVSSRQQGMCVRHTTRLYIHIVNHNACGSVTSDVYTRIHTHVQCQWVHSNQYVLYNMT